ncbi:MAG: response regulator receiver sensor signal transduction histidine kinase [Phycisphaerales bacterium]|nr:response regulator receiver sensor signal transduction histidine kinase [Phycisphaerales bacterium]
MSKILVIDDMAIFRDPIAASLRMAGYETCCAANGKEGIALLQSHQPDLILLDVSMPVMDGLTFLKTIRREKAFDATPVILLTAMADKQCVMQAAGFGVRDYLLKSRFSLTELLERVGKRLVEGKGAALVAGAAPASTPAPASALEPATAGAARTRETASGGQARGAPGAPVSPAAQVASPKATPVPGPDAPVPELLTAEECLSRVRASMQGKTLSGAVANVISLAGSPRADAAQIAGLIARDSTLSVRVLQAANSATYASKRGPVTTLTDAVRNIGCSTVRNIAATVGIFDAMPATAMDGFNPIRCWQHSFAVARLCETLIAPVDAQQGGTAYLAGLCHDLGEILIRTQFGRELQQVCEAQTLTGKPRAELERRMIGMTRGELANAVMTCMGLPDNIRGPVEAMHSARPTGSIAQMAQAMNYAELYANGLLLSSSVDAPVSPLLRAACRKAVGVENPVAPRAEEFRAEIICLAAMLARLTPADEEEMLKPLFPQQQTRVWLAREPSYSEFDPLAAALGLLAKTDVYDHLPKGEELAAYGAIVVVAPEAGARGFAVTDIQRAVAARAGGPIPVLWLTGDHTVGAKPGSLSPRHLPIPLSDLADFVESASLTPQA